MKALLAEIERVLPDGGDWCSREKAGTLAALVISLRPVTVVEIGVFSGGSAIPILLALKHVDHGTLYAIDPWSVEASVAGLTGENRAWWQGVDHQAIYRTFLQRMKTLGVERFCTVWRKPSDDCTPPVPIDVLHIDGSHTDQAVRDVERYARKVRIGGVMILDDIRWAGGGVTRAHELACKLGFEGLYPLDTGIVMQRIATCAAPSSG